MEKNTETRTVDYQTKVTALSRANEFITNKASSFGGFYNKFKNKGQATVAALGLVAATVACSPVTPNEPADQEATQSTVFDAFEAARFDLLSQQTQGQLAPSTPEAAPTTDSPATELPQASEVGETESGKCLVESEGRIYADLGHMELSEDMSSDEVLDAFIEQICDEEGINANVVAANLSMIREGLSGVNINDVNQFINIQNQLANTMVSEMSSDTVVATAYAQELIDYINQATVVQNINGDFVFDISGQHDSSVYFPHGEDTTGGLFTLGVVNKDGTKSFILEFTREDGTTFRMEVGECSQPRTNKEEEEESFKVCVGLDSNGNEIIETFSTQEEADARQNDCLPEIPEPEEYPVCVGLDTNGDQIIEVFQTQEEADARERDCLPEIPEEETFTATGELCNEDGEMVTVSAEGATQEEANAAVAKLIGDNGTCIPEPEPVTVCVGFNEDGTPKMEDFATQKEADAAVADCTIIPKEDNNGEGGNGSPGAENESGEEETNGHDNHGDVEEQDADSQGTDEETTIDTSDTPDVIKEDDEDDEVGDSNGSDIDTQETDGDTESEIGTYDDIQDLESEFPIDQDAELAAASVAGELLTMAAMTEMSVDQLGQLTADQIIAALNSQQV